MTDKVAGPDGSALSEGLGRNFAYCWLVELFEPDGNSMGYYHTGATTMLSFESRTTRDPLKAKRYATRRDALQACAGLLHLQGVWRAVEHGFAA